MCKFYDWHIIYLLFVIHILIISEVIFWFPEVRIKISHFLALGPWPKLLVNMNVDDSICANVGETCNILFDMEHQSQRNKSNAARQVSQGNRGRPSYDIKEEQLSFLLEKGFKVSEKAKYAGSTEVWMVILGCQYTKSIRQQPCRNCLAGICERCGRVWTPITSQV